MTREEFTKKINNMSSASTKLLLLVDGGRIIYNEKSGLELTCLSNSININGQCFDILLSYEHIKDVI